MVADTYFVEMIKFAVLCLFGMSFVNFLLYLSPGFPPLPFLTFTLSFSLSLSVRLAPHFHMKVNLGVSLSPEYTDHVQHPFIHHFLSDRVPPLNQSCFFVCCCFVFGLPRLKIGSRESLLNSEPLPSLCHTGAVTICQ